MTPCSDQPSGNALTFKQVHQEASDSSTSTEPQHERGNWIQQWHIPCLHRLARKMMKEMALGECQARLYHLVLKTAGRRDLLKDPLELSHPVS
jgi:hypothetical protein